MELTKLQVNILKRLEEYLPSCGSASECHDYYCPANIGGLEVHLGGRDKQGELHVDDVSKYHGKPDGFDSECPRFRAIDREKGEWECLCGVVMLAYLMDSTPTELVSAIKKHETLGYYLQCDGEDHARVDFKK